MSIVTAGRAETELPRFSSLPSAAPTAATPVGLSQSTRPVDPADIPSHQITLRRGDTIDRLAREFGTTVNQLRQLNPQIGDLDSIRAGDRINVPTNRQVVEVQPGQTLSQIAERYGVSTGQLQRTNGITDPSSIQAGQKIAIVPSVTYGLDRNSEVRAFIDDVRPIRAEWAKLTPDQRVDRLEASVNERLRAAGVPPVQLSAGGVGTANGVYDFTTHTIGVDPAMINRGTISDGQLRGLADTLYHEARHSQQWFDMARLEVARGNNPVDTMGIPQSIADAAARAPSLDPDTARGRFADAMFESVYGAGGAERNAILGDATGTRYEDYRALPEEADAWRVGGKVENLWPR